MGLDTLFDLSHVFYDAFVALGEFFLTPVPFLDPLGDLSAFLVDSLIEFFKIEELSSLFVLLRGFLDSPSWLDLLLIGLPTFVILSFFKWILDWVL